MSIRVDSTLISGALVVGDRGHGVLAENIPSTGTHGPGYAYSDLDLPTDNGKEIRGLITVAPSGGNVTSFFAYEDTSFDLVVTADGDYPFTYELFVDGVSQGTQEETVSIGSAPADETAPVLSDNLTVASPTTDGGNLTVTTDEGNGTLFWVATADGEVPTATEIQAAQTEGGGAAADSGNITVTGTGSQALGAITGLSADTVYDVHAVHVDAADNVSNVVRGTFTTAEAPDVTAPTLSLPAALLITQNSVVPVVTTDEANGTLYVVLVPDGDEPSVAQIKAGQQSDGSAAIAAGSITVTSTGVQFLPTLGGLDAETAFELAYAHSDAADNDSEAVSVGFTTLAAPTEASGVTRPVMPGGVSSGVMPGGVL